MYGGYPYGTAPYGAKIGSGGPAVIRAIGTFIVANGLNLLAILSKRVINATFIVQNGINKLITPKP
jgi:hypothetical protein